MSTAIAKNFQVGTSGTATDNFTIRQPATPDGTVRIANGNSGTTTDLVTLTSAGNLGVGTSSPTQKLEIVGDIQQQNANYLRGKNSAGTPTRLFGLNGVNTLYIGSIDADHSGGTFFVKNGATQMTLDSSGNVGIGTSTPTSKLDVLSTSGSNIIASRNTSTTSSDSAQIQCVSGGVTFQAYAYSFAAEAVMGTVSNHPLAFRTNATERARIDSSGNLLVGTTTSSGVFSVVSRSSGGYGISVQGSLFSGNYFFQEFKLGTGSQVGSISSNGTTTTYNTTSDYRLKTVIGPVADAGQRIDALQPVEYTWNSDGSRTRGFLAHQFQEVYAGSVTGTKDAVDAKGKPVYQQMQPSTPEVIADLVAEIKSLRQRLAVAGI